MDLNSHLLPVTQNLELLKPELNGQKIGEEQELSLAISETRIKNLGNIEPIKEALRYSMVLIGLRAASWPTDEEKAILISYIIENYGGHSVSEIKLAFKMAVAGKLDVEVNCYENFSVLYFASIMRAYRAWAKQAVHHIPQPKPIELPAVEVSDMEFIESVFALYKINKNYKQIPVMAYNILKNDLGLTVDAKNDIRAKVLELTGEAKDDACKRFAVKLHFDKMITDESK